MALPQMDLLKEKGYEVLLFTDEIDEFMINILMKYDDKEFKSINQGDLDLLDKKEEKKIKKLNKEKSSMLEELKKALGDQVKEVRFSTRLKDSPVCIVSNEGLSMEMERVLKSMPNAAGNIKAEKVLEINPNHDLYQTLEKVYEKDAGKMGKYAKILYSQALLIEGMELENPVEFSNLMVELMVDANKE
jgi:molecular chaperone HtpG